MNKRAGDIFSLMMDAEKPLSVSEIAKTFDVSERTIRNDLVAIEYLLESKGMSDIFCISNGIVSLRVDRNGLLSQLKDINIYTYRLAKNERRILIVIEILFAPSYVTIKNLMGVVDVSKGTLLSDLVSVREFLGSRQLHVSSSAHKGLRVDGAEDVKRLTILELLFTSGIFAEKSNQYSPFGNIVAKLMDPNRNLPLCEDILRQGERIHGVQLTDLTFSKLAYYLLIAEKRMALGCFLPEVKAILSVKDDMARTIFTLLKEQLNIYPVEAEISYLGTMLSGKQFGSRAQEQYQDIMKLQMFVSSFIHRVSDDLDIDLTGDFLLYENLIHHMQSTMMNDNLSLPDFPDISAFKLQYPNVLEVTKKHLLLIKTYINYDFTENAILYIALHIYAAIEHNKNRFISARILVACAGGMGTSQFLSERIKHLFHFEIVAVTAIHSVDSYLSSDIDLIISTSPIYGVDIPTVVVTPYINETDYERIQKALKSLKRKFILSDSKEGQSAKLMSHLDAILTNNIENEVLRNKIRKGIRNTITEFFHEQPPISAPDENILLSEALGPSNIQLDVSCLNRFDAIQKSALPLVLHGNITPSYIEKMIELLEENGPYIVIYPGFAIPHAGTESGVFKTGLSLIRLKTPVSFGHADYDPISFVCSIAIDDAIKHKKLIFNLINMIREEGFLVNLQKAKTPLEANLMILEYEMKHP
ncbi:PTS sugar transporter subunit IIA [Lachnospiraceae bacterium ZAX-1]